MPQSDFSRRPVSQLQPFFSPRTVAVFGASRERHKIGSEILHNLVSTGFTGQVVPVHPAAAELQGLRAYRSLEAYEGAVDLAVVAVPAAHVDEVVDACLAKG